MGEDLYIFDMGNVLVTHIDIIEPIIEKLDLPAEEFREDYLLHSFPMMDGTLPTADYLHHMEVRFGVTINEDILCTCFTPVYNETIAALLKLLRETGKRVVCGTNTYDSHYRYLEEHGFFRYFDTVYASHLMGVSKPDPEFFLRILESEHVSPEDTLFIDDYLENVRAALSLGMRALHYTEDTETDDLYRFCGIR
ncbi:MAG TPA: HAD-IA family hydrolase [Spirochaetia bacterium]|nr:HAD-IA family hydrolase [Spirochaetia bacterium]